MAHEFKLRQRKRGNWVEYTAHCVEVDQEELQTNFDAWCADILKWCTATFGYAAEDSWTYEMSKSRSDVKTDSYYFNPESNRTEVLEFFDSAYEEVVTQLQFNLKKTQAAAFVMAWGDSIQKR